MLTPRSSRRRGQPVSCDSDLLRGLRAGEEAAFVELVGRHHAAMVQLARSYVPNTAVAEEVVQETWLIALRGVDKFEGRSSVKTWLFRILMNRARSAGAREQRHVPVGVPERSVDSSRFALDGSWASPPTHWADEADNRLTAKELSGSIRNALDALPDLQRGVVTLRDIEGMSSAEACEVLGITHSNQRVLLHRGRSRLRQALEAEFGKA